MARFENSEGGGQPSWIERVVALDQRGDTFVTTPSPSSSVRLFGGSVAAQALAAAGATVGPGKAPHSLHCYFVRAGEPGTELRYDVTRTRDGRSFDTRHVTVSQRGLTILELLGSFHVAEPATDWQPRHQLSEELAATVPYELPSGPVRGLAMRVRRADVDGLRWTLWARSDPPAEADPLLAACALTYLSDLGLLSATYPPTLPSPRRPGSVASIDHSIWFHRPFDTSRWHLFDGRGLNTSDSLGLAGGCVLDEAGVLVATLMQQGLVRERPRSHR